MAVTPRGANKVKVYKRAHKQVVGTRKRIGDGARKKTSKAGRLVFLSAIRWGLLFKVSVVSTFIYMAGWQVNWSGISDRVQAAVNKPVANVMVKGEFKYLEQNDIQALVVEHIHGNFADIDLGSLRQSLQTNPWVKSASVQRVWPDGLEIVVTEQKPIARWGKDGMINNEGDYLLVGDNSPLASLPVLYGPETHKQQITRTYLDMTEMLTSYDLSLVGIHVDATLSWRVTLNNEMEIVFGQYDVLTKLRNFTLVYDQKLRTVSEQVVRVDMRYDNGMAVAWSDKTQTELQASR